MKRKLLLTLLIVMTLLSIAALTPIWQQFNGDSDLRLRYQKIQIGMREDEVEGILGKGECQEQNESIGGGGDAARICNWYEKGATLSIVFDSKGEVVDSVFITDRDYVEDTTTGRLLYWFRSSLSQ